MTDLPEMTSHALGKGKAERLIDPLFGSLFLLLLACCMFGGGAPSALPHMTIYFIGSICLGITVYTLRREKLRTAPKHWLVLVGLIWLFPLLQLIPLPPDVWTQIPGRSVAEAVRSAVGRGGEWHGLTIDSSQTWRTFLGVTVFATVFFATLSVGQRQLRVLLWLLCGVAFADIFIGAFQVATGGAIFDFHNSGHRANLIGFFANRNHTALYLAATMPLLTYLVGTAGGAFRRHRHYATAAGLIVLLTGVIATTSRAGLAMGGVGLLVSLAMMPIRARFLQSRTRFAIFVALAVAVIAPIAASDRLARVLQRFDSVSSDLRWDIWRQSWRVAQTYLPLGSGFGTFRLVYDPLEPLAMVSPQFVNNAHNDYLELLIEGGYPALALVLFMIAALLVRAFRLTPEIWRAGLMSIYTPAILFALLAATHSGVDYPIRRFAIAAPLALFLAILCRKAPPWDGTESLDRTKRRHRPA